MIELKYFIQMRHIMFAGDYFQIKKICKRSKMVENL
jgi:hypothetical protein